MIVKRTAIFIGALSIAALLLVQGCGDNAEPADTTEAAPAAPATPAAQSKAAADAPATEPEPADPSDAVLGYWYSEDDDSQILVTLADGEIGGKIVWLKSPNYDEEGDEEFGKPRRDRNNPDEELQDRSIVGLSMIHGFTYDAEEGQWSGGSIYDPESGKTYKCQMKLGEGDTLDVRGYIGIPALGRTTVWRRVPEGEEKSEEVPVPSA